MKHVAILAFAFHFCFVACSLNLTKVLEVKTNDFTKSEQEMIGDMFRGSKSKMNAIFLTLNMNSPCSTYSCERYSPIGLEDHLRRRGHLLDMDRDDAMDPYPTLEEFRIKNAGSREQDVFILKFTKFDIEEMMMLYSCREFDRKSFIVIFVENEEVFRNLKNMILAYGTFNVYLIKKSADPQLYRAYEMCAFCNEGRHKFDYYISWKQGSGFNKKFQFMSSFRGQFYGAGLKVGFSPNKPHVWKSHWEPGEFRRRWIYTGQDYMLLQFLAKYTNFSIIDVETSALEYCHYRVGAVWTLIPRFGYCRLLFDKWVDLAGFPAVITYWNYHFFEPSGVYGVVYTRLVSAAPKKMSKTSIKVRSTLLVAVGVAYGSFVAISFLMAFVDGERNLNNYVWILFEMFSILCLEGVRFVRLRGLRQLVMGIWLLTAFLVISVALGEITSTSVAKEPVTGYINSINDMKERNISWVHSDFTVADTLWEQLPYQLLKDVRGGGAYEALKYVLQNETVYPAAKEAVEATIRSHFWDGKGENPFHYSPPITGDSPLIVTTLLRRGSPYTEAMIRATLQMEAAGLFRGKFVPDTIDVLTQGIVIDDKYKTKEEDEEDEIAASLESISAYLWVCCGILTSSLIVFIMELFAPTVIMIVQALNELRRRVFWRD